MQDPDELAAAAFADPEFVSLNAGGICGAKHPEVEGIVCEVPAEKCFERHQAVHVDLREGVRDLSWPNPRPLPKRTSDKKAAKDMADRVEGTTSTPVPALADPERPGALVRADPHDTEVNAAVRSRVGNGTWRRKTLDAIHAAGADGMIDYDIATRIGYIEPRVASRRGELVTDGWVEDSGMRRKTGTGSEAIVWVLTAQGRAEYSLL